MTKSKSIPLIKLLTLFAIVCFSSKSTAQSKVEVKKSGGQFQLLRNGVPYSIKGVGGDSNLEALAAAGGNSIRTWNPDGLGKLLDNASKHGLTVCVGFWLGHERHGFDYQNQEAVLKQLNDTLAVVKKFKDHPAVLMWTVGNEMEGAGKNPAIWYAVNHLAREIKELDPNHPTMTVIAELGENESKIKSVERFCPHIDIIGVNSYGGISTVGSRFKKANVSKPYVVTEHGPFGPWETGKTKWNSPYELTSTEKAKLYADGYRLAVAEQKGTCLGSYAFLWGHKQETTATWFGMLLANGKRLAAVDAMTEAWTGKPPSNRCPRILEIKLDRTEKLKPGEKIQAIAKVSDPEGDPLRYEWVLRSDSGIIGAGGDQQSAEVQLKNSVEQKGTRATVTVPKDGGGFRLFFYVYDNHDGAAVANIPIQIDAPARKYPAPKAKLPFVVYGDGSNQSTFIPSGYMGNAKSVAMDLKSVNNPQTGETCLQVEYKSETAWGGVIWQSPENDWLGSKPGGLNLTGATQLEFYVRGEAGGEVVNFIVGGIEGAQPYRDSVKAELKDVELTQDWSKHTISLKGKDLSRVKTGFGWSLAGQGKPVTFYIDNIRFVGKSSQ